MAGPRLDETRAPSVPGGTVAGTWCGAALRISSPRRWFTGKPPGTAGRTPIGGVGPQPFSEIGSEIGMVILQGIVVRSCGDCGRTGSAGGRAVFRDAAKTSIGSRIGDVREKL